MVFCHEASYCNTRGRFVKRNIIKAIKKRFSFVFNISVTKEFEANLKTS